MACPPNNHSITLPNMKILVVSNLYPPFYVGGYELRCEVIVNALRERGHEVRVLTSNHGLETAPAPENEPHVKRSLRVHGYFGHPWLGIVKLRELEIHNNATLRDEIKDFAPELVHVWNLGGISKSLTLTLQRLGVPVVYDVSDHWIARSLKADVWLDWWNRKPGATSKILLYKALNWLGIRKSLDALAPTNPVSDVSFWRLYFCSDALKRLTQAKGYDVSHGAVIHCPVNTARFNGAPVSAERPMKKLLYVGRLSEDKGTMTALRALAMIKDQFNGEFCIYGKGDEDYTAQLHSFVKEHNLPVSFHHGTSAEMPAIYKAHDALIFTSEWEEPFALTPLEAMASGLPVIGTMTGGSAELFRHGQNALTYNAGNPKELSERILELAASGDLRHELAKTGQADVIKLCSEPVIVDQIEDYLRKTLTQWPQLSHHSAQSEQAARASFPLTVLPKVQPTH